VAEAAEAAEAAAAAAAAAAATAAADAFRKAQEAFGAEPPPRPQQPAFRSTGASVRPHPAKVAKGGEDAHFVCEEGLVIGVADGVGGWNDENIDPAAYSRGLMANALCVVREQRLAGGGQAVDPGAVLTEAHARTKEKGSCTALLLTLSERAGGGAALVASNLGDSGLRVVREGEVVLRSETQEHRFNCPFQLACPDFVPRTDLPSAAQRIEYSLEAGDVVVLGTDGLFDNLFDEDIGRIVAEERERLWEDVGLLARLARDPAAEVDLAPRVAMTLAVEAATLSQDRRYMSPFALARAEAKKDSLLSMFPDTNYVGGKPDDVTCVVGVVA